MSHPYPYQRRRSSVDWNKGGGGGNIGRRRSSAAIARNSIEENLEGEQRNIEEEGEEVRVFSLVFVPILCLVK